MMTTGALIAELQKRDPEGEAQIFIRDDTGYYYCSVEKVDGFINGPDAVIHAGETICTGELAWMMKSRVTSHGMAQTTATTRWDAAAPSAVRGGIPT